MQFLAYRLINSPNDKTVSPIVSLKIKQKKTPKKQVYPQARIQIHNTLGYYDIFSETGVTLFLGFHINRYTKTQHLFSITEVSLLIPVSYSEPAGVCTHPCGHTMNPSVSGIQRAFSILARLGTSPTILLDLFFTQHSLPGIGHHWTVRGDSAFSDLQTCSLLELSRLL